MSSNKPTIFEILSYIDKKQLTKIEDEEFNKIFVPFITAKWLAFTTNPVQIYAINENVNPYLFSLYKHKPLLWKLMCGVTNGKSQRYTWIKNVSESKKSQTVELLAVYLNCSKREAREHVDTYSEQDIVTIAEQMGKDKDEINKLKKEFK